VSADLLALAARAAAHYAGVRGPWLQPTTLVLESDPSRPSWLVVRDSHPSRSRDALLFNPLPRKETAMPAPGLEEIHSRTSARVTIAFTGQVDGRLIRCQDVVFLDLDGEGTYQLMVRDRVAAVSLLALVGEALAFFDERSRVQAAEAES
jgi:hypothetical protein